MRFFLFFYFFIFSLYFFNSKSFASSCTVELKISGAIGASTLDIYQRAKEKTIKDSCSSLLLLINTPGGALQTTRLIVENILNSPFPVLCLVHPSGGHAGSAGAIILQACHVSGAMLATNIGAATPILSTGKETPEDLRKKLINDTRSWIEGIAKLRGRNIKFSQEIVTKAKSVSASEAKKIGAIDILAKTKEDFLKQSQNRKVQIKNKEKKVKVKTGTLISYSLDLRYKVISLLTDPQTAYLIFMGSLGLLYFEITHPGAIIPGVLGGIGLIISLMSFHKLDVKWGGLLLLFLGLSFMLAEAFIPSFGFLGVGGALSFVLGSLFLFDPYSGHKIPLSVIFVVTIALGLFMSLIAYLAFSTRKLKKSGNYDVLLGKEALVVKVNENNNKKAMGEINGELWKVRSKIGLKVNDEVIVTGFRGLVLKVKKKEAL